jgi:putative oxidoreductase
VSLSLSLPGPIARFERRAGIAMSRIGPTALRIAMGTVFLGFGLLKVAPGVSPAERLAVETFGILTFGLVPDEISRLTVAGLEVTLGLLLLTGWLPRLAVGLLAVTLVGILSPIVLLPAQLFAGPFGAPTLEGQYVLKDVVLAAAAVVLAGRVLRRGDADHGDPSDRSRDALAPRAGSYGASPLT